MEKSISLQDGIVDERVLKEIESILRQMTQTKSLPDKSLGSMA